MPHYTRFSHILTSRTLLTASVYEQTLWTDLTHNYSSVIWMSLALKISHRCPSSSGITSDYFVRECHPGEPHGCQSILCIWFPGQKMFNPFMSRRLYYWWRNLWSNTFLKKRSNFMWPALWLTMVNYMANRMRYRYCSPSNLLHYLNQHWVIVNWTLRNKLRWNSNQNTKLFIHKNVSENIVCDNGGHFVQGEIS